jgi:hypothetical protein
VVRFLTHWETEGYEQFQVYYKNLVIYLYCIINYYVFYLGPRINEGYTELGVNNPLPERATDITPPISLNFCSGVRVPFKYRREPLEKFEDAF